MSFDESVDDESAEAWERRAEANRGMRIIKVSVLKLL